MNWYSFLDQEYSFFNPIVNRLIVLKTLKSQIIFGALPLKPHKGSPLDPNSNHSFLYKIKSFSNKTDIGQNAWINP